MTSEGPSLRGRTCSAKPASVFEKHVVPVDGKDRTRDQQDEVPPRCGVADGAAPPAAREQPTPYRKVSSALRQLKRCVTRLPAEQDHAPSVTLLS
jgi:hypothetical protein